MRSRLTSLSSAFLPAMGAILLALSGCSHEVAPSGCVQDDDCFGDGEVCVEGACALLDTSTCSSDLDCNVNAGEGCVNGTCMAGAQIAGAGCSATRDCPVNNYCNTATSQCQPLLSGWCREAAQCSGTQSLCSATSTDVPGRCVECLRDSDCGSGGTCVNPGVCEISDDRGPTPDGTDPGSDPTDPGTDPQPSDDPCETNGWYGDGFCDEGCLNPDPDCAEGGDTTDYCQEYGWYGDGQCDDFCANPDPDCTDGGGSSTEEPPPAEDECESLGYYGDGAICDDWCPQPDPDCTDSDGGTSGGGSGDTCADYGWYGDGICDTFCTNPDPDCSTPTGLQENESCVQSGQVQECSEGLDCIYDVDSNGAPSYGSCKRICASSGECNSGQQCALGFLSNGDGICGTPMVENQQGCTFWEQSGSFCFDGSGGGTDSAFLECLSGTCKFICDYETNTASPLDCPGTRSCGNNYSSYEGYGVDLAVCQ